MECKYFRVDDFGAVGDGITDDSAAVAAAVNAAAADPSESKAVIFRENAVYRSETDHSGRNFFIMLKNAENIAVRGKNTTLLMRAPMRVLCMESSRNTEFSGFVIDYSPKPYIKGTVTDFNAEAGTVDCRTEQWLGFEGEHFDAPRPFFAFPNTEERRYHYFIDSYDRLDVNFYRMNIRDTFRYRIKELEKGDEFILPFVGASHAGSAAFLITGSSDFLVSDVRIKSLPEFGFDIRYNLGDGTFDGVVFRPEESKGIHLVSWRDGFHVKDNLGKLLWKNCDIGPLGDDAFNLSCVNLNVTSVSDDAKTYHLLPAEAGKTRRLSVGDEFCAFSLKTGKEIGYGRVEEVFESSEDVCFRSDTTLPELEEGMQVAFYRYGNAGYIVEDCNIEGTVRVRGSGLFRHNRFNVFWVRVENESYVEGPIPKDVTFRDCTFTTPYDKDVNIFCVSTQGESGRRDCTYKCRNIVLENCCFEKGNYKADDGNELIVR